MNILTFDIETVPDIEAGRRLYKLEGLSDTDTASAMFLLRREKAGHNFLPPYLQKIIAISVVLRSCAQKKNLQKNLQKNLLFGRWAN
jgi:predicted PolB exonuclease-like 3'-5' exonuclease